MIAIITAFVLFSVGIYGVLSRRDLLRILISVSVILGSITLLLASQANASSYSFILFVWVIEVVEIIVALAIFIYMGKKDITELQRFKW